MYLYLYLHLYIFWWAFSSSFVFSISDTVLNPSSSETKPAQIFLPLVEFTFYLDVENKLQTCKTSPSKTALCKDDAYCIRSLLYGPGCPFPIVSSFIMLIDFPSAGRRVSALWNILSWRGWGACVGGVKSKPVLCLNKTKNQCASFQRREGQYHGCFCSHELCNRGDLFLCFRDLYRTHES